MLSPPSAGLEGRVALSNRNWNSDLESLDLKEVELHQSQLRLVREQTATFIQDLANVQSQVVDIKSVLEGFRELHSNVPSRLDSLEKALGSATRDHSNHLSSTHNSLEQLHSRLVEFKEGAQQREASTRRRVELMERLAEESAEKHARELKAVSDRLEQLTSRLLDQQCVLDQHGSSQASMLRRVEQMEALLDEHRGSHQKHDLRMNLFEKHIGDAADKHARELEEVRAAHGMLSNQGNARDARHESAAERLGNVEKILEDSVSRHANETKATQAALDQLHSRVSSCEAHGSAIDILRRAHGDLASEAKAQREEHKASTTERLDYLEQILGDSAEKHKKELDEAHAQLKHHLHGHIATSLEEHSGNHASLKKRVENLEGSSTLRLDFLERGLGDSSDKHAQQLEALRSTIEPLQGRLGEHHDKLASLYSLQERLAYVEKFLGDTAEKHGNELQGAMSGLDQLRNRLTDCEALKTSLEGLRQAQSVFASAKAKSDAIQNSMTERVDYLERAIGNADDKAARAQVAAENKFEQFHTRIATCETQHASLDGSLREAHAGVAQCKAAADAQRVALLERLDRLEQALADTTQEATRTTSGKIDEEASAREAMGSSLAKRFAQVEKAIGQSHEAHQQSWDEVRSKFDEIHVRVQTCEGHEEKIEIIRKSHTALVTDHNDRHASMLERFAYFEKLLGDSDDKHANQLKDAHAKLDHVHGRLSEERAAWDAKHVSVQDTLAKETTARDGHKNFVEERLAYLEAYIGEVSEKQAKDLEATKAGQTKLSNEVKARDGSAVERLSAVEAALSQTADRLLREASSYQAKLEPLQERIALCEKHGAELERLSGGKATSDAQQASQQVRIDNLENSFAAGLDKHSRELAALVKFEREVNSREAHHASVAERVDYLERALGDAATRHAQEFSGTITRIEELVGRVAAAENQCLATAEEQKALAYAKGDAAALDRRVTTAQEQLKYLERMLGDALDKHSRDLEAARSAQARDAAESQASMEKRLEQGFQTFGASVSKDVEQLNARISACEATPERRFASMQDRVTCLEKLIGESADKLTRELEAVKVIHGRLGAEQKAHQGTAEQRLERLEQTLQNLGQVTSRTLNESKELTGKLDQVTARLLQAEEKSVRLEASSVESVNVLRQQITGESGAHSRSFDTLVENFEGERRAREAHERVVAGYLAGEQKAREVHERRAQDHFDSERAARENTLRIVQDALAQERDSRERALEDRLQRERATYDGSIKGLQQVLAKEQELREQYLGSYQDMYQREQMARSKLEDLATQKRLDERRAREPSSERLDAIHKAVASFDGLLRQEVENRTREIGRIWSALDRRVEAKSESFSRKDSSVDRDADLPRLARSASGPPSNVWPGDLQEAAGPTSGVTAVVAPTPSVMLGPAVRQIPRTARVPFAIPAATVVSGPPTTLFPASNSTQVHCRP